jgi:hypothetical protein
MSIKKTIKRISDKGRALLRADRIAEQIKDQHNITKGILDEIYWSTVFNSAIAGSSWLINQSFNPGRWAAGYPMLYILFRIYDDIKPINVIEFGLGESSKIGFQYNKMYPDTTFTIIEQDKNWMDFFSNRNYDIRSKTIILDIEESNINGYNVFSYKGLLEVIGRRKFDVFIVDGPWGSEHYSRYDIVYFLENDLINEDFVIVMDDCERLGEQETFVKLKELFRKKEVEYFEGVYSGMKKTSILCSKKFKFLISL